MQFYELSYSHLTESSKAQGLTCPNCRGHLEATGSGPDAILECPHCGLAMFK